MAWRNGGKAATEPEAPAPSEGGGKLLEGEYDEVRVRVSAGFRVRVSAGFRVRVVLEGEYDEVLRALGMVWQ